MGPMNRGVHATTLQSNFDRQLSPIFNYQLALFLTHQKKLSPVGC